MLVSSVEPKARATADHVAERLALTATTADGLEEQHRVTAPFLSYSAFQRAMRRLFERPAELVFGEETAEAASTRFSMAIDRLLTEHQDRNVLVVTHGTVISLYLGRYAGIDPYHGGRNWGCRPLSSWTGTQSASKNLNGRSPEALGNHLHRLHLRPECPSESIQPTHCSGSCPVSQETKVHRVPLTTGSARCMMKDGKTSTSPCPRAIRLPVAWPKKTSIPPPS